MTISPDHKERRVAIAGIGRTEFSRNSGKSVGSLALSAAKSAILDAGLERNDIDGVGGVFCSDHPTVWPGYVVGGLGLNNIRWSSSSAPPSAAIVLEGINAVAAGACETALCYHAKYRWDVTSASVRNDPLRQSPPMTFDPHFCRPLVSHCPGANGFAANMRRHMHEFGSTREHFGMLAVNGRVHAQRNEDAIFYGSPITLSDYLNSPRTIDPFTLFDMDMPIDAATAVIVTTLERARDLPHKPIVVDASTFGATHKTDQIFQPFDGYFGAKVVMDALWQRSGYKPEELDVVNLYDGFSIIAMDWLEAGFCTRGEGAGLLSDSWNAHTGQIRLPGGAVVNPHGGNLSEGRTQGMGQVLEAVLQLQGRAGMRQVPDARLALATNAANPIDVGLILRADS